MADYTPNAVITAREDINDELALFRVKPIGWALPPFTPGQYAEIAIPDLLTAERPLERRSYSIASAAGRDELELYVVRLPEGYLTPKLWSLAPGASLWLGPKIKGKFTLEEVHHGKDLIMVATGTGLAPFVSMLRTFSASPPWRKVMIVHGARFERDLGYREELEARQAQCSWFSYVPALTREPDESAWSGKRGRIQALFQSGHLEHVLGEPFSKEFSHFLLCGNPQMIDDIQALLELRGFQVHKKKHPGNIHVERYW